MSNENIKLCKDCEHYNIANLIDYCTRPVPYFSLVYGQTVSTNYQHCIAEREDDDSGCGKNAIFFKPKRVWWRRLLRLK